MSLMSEHSVSTCIFMLSLPCTCVHVCTVHSEVLRSIFEKGTAKNTETLEEMPVATLNSMNNICRRVLYIKTICTYQGYIQELVQGGTKHYAYVRIQVPI